MNNTSNLPPTESSSSSSLLSSSLDNSQNSVYSLIKNLCEHLLLQESNNNNKNLLNKSTIKKLTSKSFEILLNKTTKSYQQENEIPINENENFLHHELNKILSSQNDEFKRNQCENFDELLNYLANETYLENDKELNILQFLLYLKESIPDDENNENQISINTSLLPKPFKFYPRKFDENFLRKKIYNTNGPFTLKYKLMKNEKFFINNPYLPHFINTSNDDNDDENKITIRFPRPCQPIQTIDETLSTTTTTTNLSVITKQNSNNCGLVNSNLNNNCNYLLRSKFFQKLPDDDNDDGDINDDQNNNVNSQLNQMKILKKSPKKIRDDKLTCESENDYILNWNWENLGSNKIKRALPFATEYPDSSFPLYCVINRNYLTKDFTAKIVPLNSFISDLKALIVGIQSDSFYCDENLIFHIVPNITTENIIPDIMADFVFEFLECGTCYKRIQIMIDKHNRLNNDGFIYKTLCSSINHYLIQFRHFIFTCNEKSVLEFYQKVKNMMKLLCSLALFLAVHPNANTNLKPPTGSQFLGYLYKEINHASQKDFTLLLIYIFKRCTTVYFKHLQKWIYHGILEDKCNELFINFVDHYRPQTKYYYDKAYFIRKDIVPGFFHGLEDIILQCGKYAQILKAYKPNHQLFEITYPQITVCLSFNEINEMKNKCKIYYNKVQNLCGKQITIKTIIDMKMKKRNEFHEIIIKKCQQNNEKWLNEQKDILIKRNQEKQKRLIEIQSQLEENQKRKLQEKKDNIEYELKLLQEAKDIDDKRLIEENIKIKKRIAYYEELQELIDKKNKKVEFVNKNDEKISSPLLSPTTSYDNHTIRSDQVTEFLTIESPSGDTIFESCLDDDDDDNDDDYVSNVGSSDKKSVHDEISLSQEFIDKFEETGKELQNMKKTEEKNNNNVSTEIKSNINDILNSNDEILESKKNRNKILGSNLDFTQNTTQELRVNVNNGENLTEAQKNKLKILNSEFNLLATDTTQQPITSTTTTTTTSDINSNVVDMELSEMQKNRIKMMQSDTFGNFNKENNQRKHLCLDLNTERARNRQKILSSEFDLPPITTPKSTDATPMSTTSDPISSIEESSQEQPTIVINDDDKNINLILDIEKANTERNNTTCLITTDVLETPESALNTAGLMIKHNQGFDFTMKNQSNVNDNNNTSLIDNELIIMNEQIKNNDNEIDPYKKCEELIQSNFLYKPKNSIFSIKSTKSSKLNKNTIEIKDDESENEEIHKKNTKNAFDITNIVTLTEFIQKSILIPLNTHMEIINNEIMKIYLIELNILSHFKSLKNYYFLMDGEFSSKICNDLLYKLEIEQLKPIELFNYQILHTILENSLCSSSTCINDINSQNLSFIVCDIPDKFDLTSTTVLSCLSLSYHIKWPINLILNTETLQQYSNIFKYLIKVRRISWLLENCYQLLQELRKKYGNDILKSSQYCNVQKIRHKFYNFINILKNHIISNAIQTSWKQFKDDLINVNTIEDLYRKHTIYIKRIIFLCLLNKRSVEFNNAIENIFKITIRFVRNLKSREWKRKSNDKYYTHSKYERLLNDEAEFEKCIKYVIYLGNKIVKHGYQEEIGEFIKLINFNHYYSDDIQKIEK